MANKRIKDISTTATSPAADDFVVLDSSSQGTRKIAAGPLGGVFDENVVVENGGNKTTYASNFLRSENGSYYIDAYNVGGDIIFRTSVASALDTQSMIIDGATGNVGIGTSSPGGKLTIDSGGSTQPTQSVVTNAGAEGSALELRNSAISADTATALTFTNSTIAGASYGKAKITAVRTNEATGNTDVVISTSSSGSLSEAVRIDSSQRVGIGTASPDSTLEVTGASATSNNGATVLVTDNASVAADVGGTVALRGTDGSTDRTLALVKGGKVDGTSAFDGYLSLQTRSNGAANTTEAIRIDSSQRVGIGTNSPGSYDGNADDLVVATNGDTGVSIRSSSTGGGNIYFADGTTGDQRYRGYVSYAHSTDTMSISSSGEIKLRAGASEAVRIDSSGKLGVNNSTPGSYNSSANNLVVGDGANHEGLTIASGTAHQGGIYFADGTAGAAQYAGFIYYDHGVNTFRIGTNGTTVASIDSSGRLGVGTSSPTNKLTVASGDIQLEASKATDVDVQSINWKNTNSSGYDIARITAATGGNIYEGQLKFLTKDSGGTMATRATIDSAGNVNIGDGNLEFNSGADLKLFHDSSNGYIQNVTGDLNLKNASAEYIKMLIATGGVELYHNGTKQCETVSTGISFPSGKGIDFSATGDGSGTMSSEVLDDYEEGTWSPQFYSSGGTLTATMDVRSARYVKVGHKVTVMCYIRTSNVDNSSASGALRISGLPYAVAGSNHYTAVNVGYALNWSTAPAGGYTETSQSNIVLTRWSALGENLSPSSPADLTNGSGTKNEVMLTATYCSF